MQALRHILVVDDDQTVRELVSDVLTRSNFGVITAGTADEGLEIVALHQPDLMILDIRMPGLDGLEALRRVRSDKRTATLPVILLTAESAEADRVVGLELGADDYVSKPFSPRELVARVKSVLRRTRQTDESAGHLQQGDLVLDSDRHVVTCSGQVVALTATEFRIVQCLMQAGGKTVERKAIYQSIHNEDADPLDRTIDAHIKSIRRKLGGCEHQIETIRGFGYKVRSEM
ncbi:MAG TPA: response regulator transcription factor [Tepidisphaeraceae bacterium]